MKHSIAIEEILNDRVSPELISLYMAVSDLLFNAKCEEHIEKLNLLNMIQENYDPVGYTETVEGILRETSEYVLTAHGIEIDDNIEFKYLYNILFAVLTFDNDDLLPDVESIVMLNDNNEEKFARFVELRTSVDITEFYLYIKNVSNDFMNNLISAVRLFNEGYDQNRVDIEKFNKIRSFNKEHQDALSNTLIKEGVSIDANLENLYNANKYRIRESVDGAAEDILSLCKYTDVSTESLKDECIWYLDDWFKNESDRFMAVKALDKLLK